MMQQAWRFRPAGRMLGVGNQQQYDAEVQERISRLLTHLGQVLQELGGLMPAQLPLPKSEADLRKSEKNASGSW